MLIYYINYVYIIKYYEMLKNFTNGLKKYGIYIYI